jgi:hypothetical protein
VPKAKVFICKGFFKRTLYCKVRLFCLVLQCSINEIQVRLVAAVQTLPIPANRTAMHTLASVISSAAVLYLYGRWFYTNRENIHYYLAPIWILLGCLLVAGMSQSHVFQRAEVESYTKGEGWISEMKYSEPNYVGEETPLLVVTVGPIVGLILMLMVLPRGMRRIQGVHFVLLLLFVYPLLAFITLSKVGGNRPRFYDGTPLPAIGTRVLPRP